MWSNFATWIKRSSNAKYYIGASLFCRGTGLIYLIAILSWWVQAETLICKDGLVPIQTLLDFLDQRWADSGSGSRWNLPTLFWILGASDAAIHILCAIGCAFALLAIIGFIQGPALIGCWIIYLSLVTTGDTFMSFQWDILLLETGVIAVLLSGWGYREKLSALPALNLRRKVALILAWIVIAKLMFLSGWVKLAWATGAQPEWWPAHTAMTFHYQTQPLPTWTAWAMHQMPVWFHKLSIWPMYFVEIILPFFVLFGYRCRAVAAAGFTVLMVLILLTGNYTYFNLLTIVLCLPLVADRFWPRKWFPCDTTETKSAGWKKWLPFGIAAPCLALLFLLNFQVTVSNLHRSPKPILPVDLSPGWLNTLAGKLSPFHLCSGYGLFRTMTTDRPEIILQGSADGITWKDYDFKWKPDTLDERPRFVAPHQPRVAWQLWFAALERQYHPRSRNSRWFEAMILKILKGEESVQALFRENPFPDRPPQLLRAKLYLYEFTDIQEFRQTGNWWKRQEAGIYLKEVRLPK